jgi:hypothetical protein
MQLSIRDLFKMEEDDDNDDHSLTKSESAAMHNSDRSMAYLDALEFSARLLDASASQQQDEEKEEEEEVFPPSPEEIIDESLILNDILKGVDETKICFCRSGSFSLQESSHLSKKEGFSSEGKLLVNDSAAMKEMERSAEYKCTTESAIPRQTRPTESASPRRGVARTRSEGTNQAKRSLLDAMKQVSSRALNGLETEIALAKDHGFRNQIPSEHTPEAIKTKGEPVPRHGRLMRTCPQARGIPHTRSEDPSQPRRTLLQTMRSISVKAVNGLDSELPNDKNSVETNPANRGSPTRRRGVNRTKSEQKPRSSPGSLLGLVKTASVMAIQTLGAEVSDHSRSSSSSSQHGLTRSSSSSGRSERPSLSTSLSKRSLWQLGCRKSKELEAVETNKSTKPMRPTLQNTSFRWNTIDTTGHQGNKMLQSSECGTPVVDPACISPLQTATTAA